MKTAAIRSSFDLEHMKNGGLSLYDKGPSKKIYLNLHKAIKGEDNVPKDAKSNGPLTAPG